MDKSLGHFWCNQHRRTMCWMSRWVLVFYGRQTTFKWMFDDWFSEVTRPNDNRVAGCMLCSNVGTESLDWNDRLREYSPNENKWDSASGFECSETDETLWPVVESVSHTKLYPLPPFPSNSLALSYTLPFSLCYFSSLPNSFIESAILGDQQPFVTSMLSVDDARSY